MARRLEICRFILLSILVDAAGTIAAPTSTKLLLELGVGARHHALAAEEHEMKPVVPCHHRPHGANTSLLEFLRDPGEQGLSDAPETRTRLDRQGKDPAARRRAEFPSPHLADDEAEDGRPRARRRRLGDQEQAVVEPALSVAREDVMPIFRLGDPGHAL